MSKFRVEVYEPRTVIYEVEAATEDDALEMLVTDDSLEPTEVKEVHDLAVIGVCRQP